MEERWRGWSIKLFSCQNQKNKAHVWTSNWSSLVGCKISNRNYLTTQSFHVVYSENTVNTQMCSFILKLHFWFWQENRLYFSLWTTKNIFYPAHLLVIRNKREMSRDLFSSFALKNKNWITRRLLFFSTRSYKETPMAEGGTDWKTQSLLLCVFVPSETTETDSKAAASTNTQAEPPDALIGHRPMTSQACDSSVLERFTANEPTNTTQNWDGEASVVLRDHPNARRIE